MPLPAGTAFESASTGCTPGAASVICTRASLAAGADAMFDVTVRTATASNDGSVTVKPKASAATADPDGSNDESSAATVVTRTPSPPDPLPGPLETPTQKLELGNALEGARSGVIFVPITCTNDAMGFCTTSVTITFRKPHQKLKPIKRTLRIASGQMSVAFMSASLRQRKKIRVIRHLGITVTATNPPGPPVKRNSMLSGHPRPRKR
jgi:hypothetical protein